MTTKSFADEIAASLPNLISLPPAFRTTFDWMAANGYVGRDRSGVPYAQFVPIGAGSAGCCGFHPDVAPQMFRHWTGNDDPSVAARLAIIMRTGGDGSHAAIWCDEEGRQRFVHLGSGSGSTMVCVLTDDPVDMLRLFAIGYDELCWPEALDETPAEVAEQEDFDPPAAPSAYATFIATTFGVTIPQKASEIVTRVASLEDGASDDAFWLWSKSVCR